MSGIVGGSNNRGSGLIADLGTDGQILTSAGLGLRQVFEAASASQFKHIHGSYNMATTGSLAVTGVGFAPLAVLGMANSGDYTNASWGWTVKTDAGFDDINLLDQHDYSADMMGWVATAMLTLWHSSSKYSYMVATSFDADGVTFNRAKYSTPTLTFNYFLLFLG